MFKKIAILAAAACGALAASAQQPAQPAQSMVAITPMVSYALDLPDDARQSLAVKLGQMVTQNGFGSASGQFVLTANVVTIDKQATATAPVQYMVKLEVSTYVVDLAGGTVMGETSFNVTGVDRLENKAVIQAINQIKPKSPAAQAFMNGARDKIVEYYTVQTPALMTKARSLASRNEYEAALELLSGIPDCVPQYEEAAKLMSDIYLKMVDRTASAALVQAKGKVAVKDYEGALAALEDVDPSSSHAKEALAVVNQIRSSVNAKDQAALNAQLNRYEEARRDKDDAVMLEKMRIDAVKSIGVAAAKNQSSSMGQRLGKWFTGKFR